jgi:alcohol dehydrogenase (cytochrome c)
MIADAKKEYWSTNAPLVVRNHLIVGVSGDFDNLPGVLKSFDLSCANGPRLLRYDLRA